MTNQERLRVGMVGAGGISSVHALAWVELGAEVAVFSHDRAEGVAAITGGRVAPSFAELLAGCDIVDIVTPTPSHAETALAAFAAGKHVICEKPLAGSVADAERMIAAANAAERRLFPAHVVRYFPEYEAIRAAAAAGDLGELAVLRFSRAGAAPAPGSWFFDEAASGGIIMDQMMHDLDQALWIAGPVMSVYAIQSPGPDEAARPERVSAHVTMTHRSGAISVAQGSWGPVGLEFQTAVEVAGSRGVLRHESGDARTIRSNGLADTASGYLPATGAEESPYLTELRDFAEAIRGRREARVSPRDGLDAVALATAARESVRSGQPVALGDAGRGTR